MIDEVYLQQEDTYIDESNERTQLMIDVAIAGIRLVTAIMEYKKAYDILTRHDKNIK